jgi:putative ABC transport system permease protein
VLNSLSKDIRYAIRGLWQQPGFAVVVVITLALGIGVNTAIFSITDKLLIRSLAVSNPGELVLLNSVSVSPYFVSNNFSYPNFTDYRDQNHEFAGLMAFSRTRLELLSNGAIERVPAEYVSGNYFDLLGIRAARGRTFLPDEDKTAGTQPVVVISQHFQRNHFSLDQDPLGQKLTLNNVPLTIIGIAPSDYNGIALEQPTDIWVPLLMHPQLAQSKFVESRKDGFVQVMGRIKPGITSAEAEAGMDLLARQIKEAHTPAGTITKGLPFSEQHIKFEPGGKGISTLRKKFSAPLKLLSAIVALVLVIACANVGGLFVARGFARRKEVALRRSLGATGWRLARQLLVEGLLVAGLGGLGGLLLAPWLITLLVNTQAKFDTARTLLAHPLDWRVLGFTFLITLVAGLGFGLAPALSGSRSELIRALKDHDNGFRGGNRMFGFRGLLVVGQLSLAIVVLAGAGLCIRSFKNLVAIDPGYQTEHLLVVPVDLDDKKYDEAHARIFQQQVERRLKALPGIESISDGLVPPLSGGRYVSSLIADGSSISMAQSAFDGNTVGAGYHETMGIHIVRGRDFTTADQNGPAVVIVNKALAARLFPGQDAVGKTVRKGPGMPPMEVVGVAEDIKYHDLVESALPHFDVCRQSYGSYTNFVLRTRGPAADLIPRVRAELLSLDPSLQTNQIESMAVSVGNVLAPMRLASTLVGLFGGLALLMAGVGLYGVMAWMVGRRTREVGIRIALGAKTGDVLTLVIRQGMILTSAGIGLGLIAAFAGTRLIRTQLYQVSATDPATFVVIAVVMAAVSLLACYLPARRATKVDPLVALRYE